MSLPFWIACKNLASRRLQAVTAVLGIAFGTATVCAVLIVDHDTVAGVRDWHRRNTGAPDLVLRFKGGASEDLEARLAELAGDTRIAHVTPVLASHVAARPASGPGGGMVLVGVRPGSAGPFDAYVLAAGSDLDVGNGQRVLLGEQAAEDLQVGIGSALVLQRPPVTRAGCLDGEIVARDADRIEEGAARTFIVSGILEQRYVGARSSGRVAVVAFADAVDLMGRAPFRPEVWVRAAPGADTETLQEHLGRDWTVEVPLAREVGEDAAEKAFRSGVRTASFLALGLGLFIIFHVLDLAVASWVRQLGLLGALGVTGRTLALIFLAEAAILALAGTGLGAAIGVGVSRLLLGLRVTSLGWGRPVGAFEVPWGEVGVVAVLGLAACLLGAIAPILKLRRVGVLDALLEGGAALRPPLSRAWGVPVALAAAPLIGVATCSALGWLEATMQEVALLLSLLYGVFVLLLWALPGLLARAFGALLRPFDAYSGPWLVHKGLERGLRRLAGAVSALALVSAGLVTLHGITGALKREADAFSARALPGHVYLYLQDVPRNALAGLEGLPGVRSVIPAGATVQLGFLVRGVDPEPLFREGLLAGDPVARRAFEAGEGLVVTADTAREHDLRVGGSVSLPAGGGPRRFRVLAIDDRFGFFPHEREYGLVSEDIMRRAFCRNSDLVRQLSVTVAGPEVEHEVLQQIVRTLKPGVHVEQQRTGAGLRRHYQREIDRDFAIFDAVLLLTGVLAGLGLLNSLLVAGIERRKETGLLRAVGLTRRQVSALLLAEAGMIGLAGGTLGALMGLPFSWLAVDGLARLSGLPLTWEPEIGWMIGAAAGVTAIALFAALLPAARAASRDVIASIRHE